MTLFPIQKKVPKTSGLYSYSFVIYYKAPLTSGVEVIKGIEVKRTIVHNLLIDANVGQDLEKTNSFEKK